MARSKITRVCENCQESFYAWSTAKARTGEGRFCSRNCKTIYNRSRFWEKADKTEKCWIWKGNRLYKRGYGLVKRGNKQLRAHRIAYEMTYGPIPEGLYICHKCDNPSCVNPNHLYAGTHADNTRDAVQRKRVARNQGEQAGNSRLKNGDIQTIRSLYAKGDVTMKEIAAMFHTDGGTISRIVNRKAWGHI